MFCSEVGRIPSILPMKTKSQGNEVILSIYYHSNLIRTTALLIKTKINQVKLQHLLQNTFTILHETNNQSIVPNPLMSNNCYNNCSIVPFPCSMFNVHTSSPLHYRTSQNQSQDSQLNLSNSPMQK